MTILTRLDHWKGICSIVVSLAIAIFPFKALGETKTYNPNKFSRLQKEFANTYIIDSFLKRPSKDLGWGEKYDHFYVHHWPDPVNVRNGNLFLYYQDLFIPSMAIPLRIERVYNSRSVYRTPFGYGWNFNYFTIITSENDGKLKTYESDGSITIYKRIRRTEKYDTYVSTRDKTTIIMDKNTANYIRFLKNCGKEYFDQSGRLVKLVDRNGNSTILRYDKTGNLTSVTDPSNRVITLTYDNNGLITSIKDPIDRELKYAYDKRQNLIAAVDANGHTTKFFYDDLHNMTLITYPDGSDTAFEYDIEKDLIVSEKGPGQRKTTYRYYSNAGTLITVVTDSLGRKTKYSYEELPEGLKFTEVDPMGKRIARVYDNEGNVLKQIDKNDNEAFFGYDDLSRLTSITDPSGNVTKIAYLDDCSGDFIKSLTDSLGNRYVRNYDDNSNVMSIIDPLGYKSRMAYDSMGNLISISDAMGFKATLEYDRDGNIISIKDHSGNVKRMEYDRVSRLISVADTKGRSTKITYDNRDRIIEIINPLGYRTAYVYNVVGKIKSVANPDKNRVDYVYDEFGYLSKIIDANGNTQNFRCDSEGNQIAISDFNNNLTKLYYDSCNRLIKTEDPYGNMLKYDYDAMTNLLKYSDSSGKALRFVSDRQNRIIEIIDSGENKIRLMYDPNGNLVSIVDEMNKEYRLFYDALNRLIRRTDAAGHSVQYVYDPAGNIKKTIDENRNQHQFEFNESGGIAGYHDPLGRNVKYDYDVEGNVIAIKNRRGGSTTYDYDSLGRLLKSMTADKLRATYSYDSNGNVVSASNANVSYAFEYDKVGNLRQKAAKIGSLRVSLENKYDAQGNRTALDSKGIKLRAYEYDKNSRITRIQNQFGEEFIISYNDLGLRERILYPNGISAVFDYGQFDKLCELTFSQAGGKILKKLNYAYDETGNLKECVENDVGLTKYKYDKVGRLGAVIKWDGKTRSYEYDPAGNRISMNDFDGKTITYKYNVGNQLIRAGGISFEYDPDGNMVSKRDNDRLSSFLYDGNNFLTEVTTIKTGTTQYGYGPFGERLFKENNGKKTSYVHDNEDILWELSAGGDVIAEYTHGPGFDTPLSVRIDNKSYYFHADRMGNILLVTNTDGSVICRYSYTPFGEFEQNGAQIGNIHLFNGKVYDAESGLYYFINRYYDPSVGRFVQEDPIKVSLDQSNLYVYVGNNPLNLVDPLGLEGYRGVPGLIEDFWKRKPVWVRAQEYTARQNNVVTDSGKVPSLVNKKFDLLKAIKSKDPAQLAKDCGTGGTSSNVDGSFGVRVGAGLRGDVNVRFDRSSAQFKIKAKGAIASSAELKGYINVKHPGGTKGMDALGGTNVGGGNYRVNYAFGVDSNGKPKGQLKVNAGPLTIKTNFGEGGKLESGQVEMGPGVSIPNVRFKKDLGETETSIDIPLKNIVDQINKVWLKECP